MKATTEKFLTTLDYSDVPSYLARASIVRRPGKPTVVQEMVLLGRVLRRAWGERRLLLSSSWGRLYPDLLATGVIGTWPRSRRPVVVLAGCMWQPNSGLRGVLERIAVRLADRAIHRYVVQSTEELAIFPRLWNVRPAKMRLALFCCSLDAADRETPPHDSSTPYIFSAGNSHRDYDPLLEVARILPQHRYVFATNRIGKGSEVPSNIEAGPVSHRQMIALLKGAALTMISIRKDLKRAAGQQTFLNSMALGIPTIVNEAPSVRDHVRHKETGFIVEGSAESFAEAVEWVLDPAHAAEVRKICSRARDEVTRRYTRRQHAERLLSVMAEDV